MRLFVEAIHCLLNRNSFPNLIGIKKTLNGGCDLERKEIKLWNTFPKSLSHLDLYIWQFPQRSGSIKKLEKVSIILQQHTVTLRTLNLFWGADKDLQLHSKLELPRIPLLSTLDFTSMATLDWDGWTLEMLDFLKLRELFLVCSLRMMKIGNEL